MAPNEMAKSKSVERCTYFPEIMTCLECKKTYVVSNGKKTYAFSRKRSKANKCYHCRRLMRRLQEGKPIIAMTICILCGEETKVPFLPKDEEKTYCAPCYKTMGFKRKSLNLQSKTIFSLLPNYNNIVPINFRESDRQVMTKQSNASIYNKLGKRLLDSICKLDYRLLPIKLRRFSDHKDEEEWKIIYNHYLAKVSKSLAEQSYAPNPLPTDMCKNFSDRIEATRNQLLSILKQENYLLSETNMLF